MNFAILVPFVTEAAAIPENIREDGTINWDYVSADVWIDQGPHHKAPKTHHDAFQALLDVAIEEVAV